MRIAILCLFVALFTTGLFAQGYKGIYLHKDVKSFLSGEKRKHKTVVGTDGIDFFKKYIEVVNSGESYATLKAKYPNFITDFVGNDMFGLYELRYNHANIAERVYYFVYKNTEVYYLYAEGKNGQPGNVGTLKSTADLIKARRDEIVKTRIAGKSVVEVNPNWTEYSLVEPELSDVDKNAAKDVVVYYNQNEISLSQDNIADKIKNSEKVEGQPYDIHKIVFHFGEASAGFSEGLVEKFSSLSQRTFTNFIDAVAVSAGVNIGATKTIEDGGVYYNFIKAESLPLTYLAIRGFLDGRLTINGAFNMLSDSEIGSLLELFDNGRMKEIYNQFYTDQDCWEKIIFKMGRLSSLYGTYLNMESKLESLNDQPTKADFDAINRFAHKMLLEGDVVAAQLAYDVMAKWDYNENDSYKELLKDIKADIDLVSSLALPKGYYVLNNMPADYEEGLRSSLSIYLYDSDKKDIPLQTLIKNTLSKIKNTTNELFSTYKEPVENVLTIKDCNALVGSNGLLYYLWYKSASNTDYLPVCYILSDLVRANVQTAELAPGFDVSMLDGLKIKLDIRMEELSGSNKDIKDLKDKKDSKEIMKSLDYFMKRIDYKASFIKAEVKGY